MGYNLKNTRNGKSVAKIQKWPSLRSLALKSKLIRQYEFFENLEYVREKMMLESKVLLSRNFFRTNLLSLF